MQNYFIRGLKLFRLSAIWRVYAQRFLMKNRSSRRYHIMQNIVACLTAVFKSTYLPTQSVYGLT